MPFFRALFPLAFLTRVVVKQISHHAYPTLEISARRDARRRTSHMNKHRIYKGIDAFVTGGPNLHMGPVVFIRVSVLRNGC